MESNSKTAVLVFPFAKSVSTWLDCCFISSASSVIGLYPMTCSKDVQRTWKGGFETQRRTGLVETNPQKHCFDRRQHCCCCSSPWNPVRGTIERPAAMLAFVVALALAAEFAAPGRLPPPLRVLWRRPDCQRPTGTNGTSSGPRHTHRSWTPTKSRPPHKTGNTGGSTNRAPSVTPR